MNRILAVLTLFLPLAAAAQTEIYGQIKSGIETSHTKTRSHSFSKTVVADQGSYIGLRGSHPIGGGKVIWQAEQDAPTTDTLSERWQARKKSGETWIGWEK
ncbi:porin [Neisseria sp.]|uniref:porin n=1 Tax=Neisseria sp. TaxID=192066 RepID=UPI0035A160FF